MQTPQFLHRILTTSATLLHSARFNALATCVEALLSGQRLSLTAVGRRLPRRIQPKHAIKCVDRLLGNHGAGANTTPDAPSAYRAYATILMGSDPI